MKDPERIDRILEYIRKVWKHYPDLRLTQLLINALDRDEEECLYYVEDVILENKLFDLYDNQLPNKKHG